jgi:hypothetical protein|tara:strand:- start:839 stop:1060 length:222 start_codon:yes stop_codon:yes gene_type:complete
MEIKISCTNGNATNHITGSRVRWTCLDCKAILAEHHSPCRGPAGYYERKHPAGEYAEHFNGQQAAAFAHACIN